MGDGVYVARTLSTVVTTARIRTLATDTSSARQKELMRHESVVEKLDCTQYCKSSRQSDRVFDLRSFHRQKESG